MTVLRTSLRGFLAHKGRMALSGIAVLLSVAFVCGTLVFTDTMNTTFDKIFAQTAPDVTVSNKDAKPGEEQTPNGKPDTVPASAVDQVRKVEGVRSAEGVAMSLGVTVVTKDNKNVGSDTGAPTIASNWTRVDQETMKVTSGKVPSGPNQVMVDADTADKHGLELGDSLRTITGTGEFTARISGVATFEVTNPGAAIVYLDTPTAQRELLGSQKVFSQVAVAGESGYTHTLLKENVAEALGASAYTYQTQKETADANRGELSEFLDVLKYGMLGFAGIALLVGIFLIVNTFSMLVAQRTREMGLMRAIGSSRRQVGRTVLLEALLLGVIGSVLGVGAGVGLAVGLMQLMGAVGMKLSTDDLTVAWTTPVIGVVVGVLVTMVAAYLPARRAGRVSPMAAMREAGTPADRRTGVLRAVAGVVLSGGGAALLALTANADEASTGALYLAGGVLLSLIGFIVIGPVLAGVLVRLLSAVIARPFGRIGRLAERNALRNPRRTGATAAALMIGLALVASLSVVGSSMVASAEDELDKTVGADFIVEGKGGMDRNIIPAVERKFRAQDGLKDTTSYRWVDDVRITAPDGGGRNDKEWVSITDPSYADVLKRDMVDGELAAAYERGAISVGSDYAEKHGVSVGDTITVDFPRGTKEARLKVAAITSDDTALDKGAKFVSLETARDYLPANALPQPNILFATAVDGEEEATYAALKKLLEPYPQYQVQDQADYKQTLKDQIGQLLNLVYGLLALAIIVAILGVVNTLALSVVERTREIGMLRAIGLSRRQMRRMIRLEAVVIALFGALLGVGLGMAWGAAAQQLLAMEGLGVLEIPWPTIVTVFAGSALVGLIAALVPAFRAGRMNVLNAIATE
ncbi:ABC transporter permease [Streptomyces sp. AJS327]|uniref:ABC transporter permease n=1 Tax=Streptomyces sp. AJS327 TaxID=2545265 RepID=UPI0015DEE53E|nr:ABC transporter permease [Streptomyces sp. AJS327]MBA0049403.1 ABC transporter permease [Streptomyces sp. AJS327]